MRRTKLGLLFPFLALLLLLAPSLGAQEMPLSIVASHSIAADVVARVAGDDAEVMSLIPRGSDPHGFVPTPASLRLLADADLVFVNGANYEEGLIPVIGAAVDADRLFVISQCVATLPGGHHHENDDHADEHEHEGEDDHADEHEGEDEDEHADEHEGEDEHADEHEGGDEHADEHEGEDEHADEHEGEDEHADEHEGEDEHADEHEGEDEHADEHEGEGEDDHADEHEHEGEDEHADEHMHEGEGEHYDVAIHEGAEERCAQHEMELGERFLRLQDEEISPGPLYAVDCGAMGGCDPHFWLQARNVALWALTVRDILATHDSAHAEGYFERSEAYLNDIEALEQEELLPLVASLAPEQRLLVTHHDALGYLARTYGFTELGGVVEGFSTMAEPGAADMAALIDEIRERNLPAIFGEMVASNDLVEQVAAETGASVVPLSIETLGEEGSPDGTWIGFMRTLVGTIVNALSGGAGG